MKQNEVAERFLADEDAASDTGNLVSKIYEDTRILQHYLSVEAVRVKGGGAVKNYECWTAGWARCPHFKALGIIPITGLKALFNVPLTAIAEARFLHGNEAPPQDLGPFYDWVEIDGYRYGYYRLTSGNYLLACYDRQLAYIYRIYKDTRGYWDIAKKWPPEFENQLKFSKRVPITYLREYSLRNFIREVRWISKITSLPDIRALSHVCPYKVELGNYTLPMLRVIDGHVEIIADLTTVFRVEVFHDFFGRRGTVAKVIALNKPFQHPPVLEDLPRVVGLWLVGRDVTGQVWCTDFHWSYYKCSVWTMDRLAMGLRPGDRMVDES